MGTSMKVNRTFGTDSGGEFESLHRLIEREIRVTLAGSETLYIPVDVGFDRFEIRTVFVEPNIKSPFVLSMFDKEADGNIIYRSLEETSLYDIVNVPCEDKDGVKALHCFLENKGSSQTEFRLIIKMTNFL